jgi:uncharacterized repeat protein (TIGR01451 family)
MKKIVAGIAIALLLSTTVWAQQKGTVELISTAEVEVVGQNAQGEEKVTRVEASKTNVAPGDTVIFSVRYTNKGAQTDPNVVITNPVPEHMMYVDRTAEGKGTRIEFSADKGRTFAPEGKVKLKGPDGKERLAAAREYTTIRWIIEKPVAKGEKGTVSFRAKVK